MNAFKNFDHENCMLAPPDSINCNFKILELTEGSFNQNMKFGCFQKEAGDSTIV